MEKAVIGILLFSLLMLGCSVEQKQPKQDATIVSSQSSSLDSKDHQAYIPSAIHPEFPVPKQAQKTNHRSNNPNIIYVRYAYQGLMDLKKRDQYFKEIEKWGWQEKKQEQMGSMHIFEKGNERIHVTIHSDFFTIFTQKD